MTLDSRQTVALNCF